MFQEAYVLGITNIIAFFSLFNYQGKRDIHLKMNAQQLQLPNIFLLQKYRSVSNTELGNKYFIPIYILYRKHSGMCPNRLGNVPASLRCVSQSTVL